MEQSKYQVLTSIRNYLNDNKATIINLLEICEKLNYQLNEICIWAPTPNSLLHQILELKSKDLKDVLSFEKYDKESAIDSMVISGQEIYERFEQLSPAKYLFILDVNPDLYADSLNNAFELIENHLKNNLDKGIQTGEYKADLNTKDILTKYMQRIKDIHKREYLSSEHFTFANVFSNIFEDYLEEVATSENWNYFRKRKQFYEAISFVHR